VCVCVPNNIDELATCWEWMRLGFGVGLKNIFLLFGRYIILPPPPVFQSRGGVHKTKMWADEDGYAEIAQLPPEVLKAIEQVLVPIKIHIRNEYKTRDASLRLMRLPLCGTTLCYVVGSA
jgi:hypothetical protein